MENNYEFGQNSTEQLLTCHQDLQKIAALALSRSNVDFGISEGHRSISRQHKLYIEGKSQIDGINKQGKHNKKPSEALDFFAYHPEISLRKKIAYDRPHLSYIGGLFESAAKELYAKGEITHLIRWGGNWDRDGVISFDHIFIDMPHVEIYKPKKI